MERVRRAAAGWYGDRQVRNTAIYWTASLAVSVINYLYYPVLGRLMQPAAYGETQTVISIFSQAAVVFQVLALVNIGVIARYDRPELARRVNDELARLATVVAVALLVATLVFAGPLARFFQFASVWPFVLLAMSLAVAVPLSFANSYLQGHKRFWTLSIGNLMAAGVKLVASAGMVMVGFGALGAIGGLIVAQVLALAYSLRKGTGLRWFVRTHLRTRAPDMAAVRPEMGFAGIVLITSITTNLMLSFDILVVKHFFPPAEAGLYSGISIISNIIFFLTGPIAGSMIPSIKPGDRRSWRLFLRNLGLVLALGGSTTILFICAPRFVVSVLLGARFTPYADYLRGLSVALFGMSVANLAIYYQIGRRNFWVAAAVGGGLVGTLAMLARSHATMGMVVADLVYGSLILLGLLVISGLVGRRAAA